MRWYDWRKVVKVARGNDQKCASVIKAICTHLSSLENPFTDKWEHVKNKTFHVEEIEKNAKKRNGTIYSSEKRHVVGLRCIKTEKSRPGNVTTTFDVNMEILVLPKRIILSFRTYYVQPTTNA